MKNAITLKTVSELLQFSFYIPSYQRGYRWTAQEVTDLLNDIDEFIPREVNGTDEKTWYCLQPIVVKRKENNAYEVIDGQQRLTTIYLILHYLNQGYVESRRDNLFSIEYETREKSKEFLKNPETENNDNIDFFHIHNAYTAIHTWFLNRGNNFDESMYRSKFKFNSKVIWYETMEKDTISVFTRLNIGKINLTNSELIKALFLNNSNFHSENNERLRLRQIEIANEWDNIENALQNNKFWYFLSDKYVTENRIEYIFDLMKESDNVDRYATFRYFNSKLNNKTEEDMKQNWEDVQFHYQRFNEWFNDRFLYHKIGFILNTQIVDVKTLYEKSSIMQKNAFIDYLDCIIKDFYRKDCLLDLDYEDKHTNSVLLLYNILTMLQNSHDGSYFPFDTFKLLKWNKEHIASIKEAIPKNNRNDWLSDVRCYIDIDKSESSNLITELDACLLHSTFDDDDVFIPLFYKITDHFNQYMSNDDINGISNLALLDESTNKSYKNAVFPLKRKRIIDLDKSGEFVPLCTKNTFLKYFSDYPPKISFWSQEDREMYEKDLIRVLSEYMEVDGCDEE
ncbi:DUF262 domain-containing protein [Clostridium sp. UBA3887]|uniref:DUF262 domain-containing protein n=1 Tax=Clostridium sp. UBA3887 TaxID=1946356 RepID=UPI003217ADDD